MVQAGWQSFEMGGGTITQWLILGLALFFTYVFGFVAGAVVSTILRYTNDDPD